MSPETIDELRLCHAAARVEACLAEGQDRRTNIEALQRALIRNADAIMRLVDDHQADQATIARLATALRPFARAATVLSPGHNPVLLSLPSPADDGRTFVQLRPADFRRAASVLEAHP